jgi:hypothetical protein
MCISRARFEQQNPDIRISTQAMGQHATGASSTDDDVVKTVCFAHYTSHELGCRECRIDFSANVTFFTGAAGAAPGAIASKF